MKRLSVLLLFALAACQTPQQPAVEVRTVEVLVEVPAPCPGTVPDRPLPFVKPNGEGLEALAAALAAKLAEYSAPGKYADLAEAYFESCPPAS